MENNGQKTKLLATGATGFVGKRFCRSAVSRGFSLRRVLRPDKIINDPNDAVAADISPDTDWRAALEGVDVIVHLAAMAHVPHRGADNMPAAFRRVNTEATLGLAKQAATAGVRRFVFISSVKVNGAHSRPKAPFTPLDPADPKDPYAISKHEAEKGLRRLACDTGLEVVIIRPPLVYGPGVKANFLRLLQAVHKGLPLPLGRVENKRSLVALDNLVDLIITCIDHPAAAGQTFMVSDGDDLSTPELIRRLASAMGRPARLVPVPLVFLETCSRLAGLERPFQQLCQSLQVDIAETQQWIGWRPQVSVDAALQETVRFFLAGKNNARPF